MKGGEKSLRRYVFVQNEAQFDFESVYINWKWGNPCPMGTFLYYLCCIEFYNYNPAIEFNYEFPP
jgi:hypothetical protein